MSQTIRESVVALQPKTTTPATISLPIDAIREAVRAEMSVAHQVATETAIRAAASSVAAARLTATQGVLHAVAALLAVRMLLLLALCGGFILALMAVRNGGYQAAGVLVAYSVLIVLPLVWLERNPRTERPSVG